MANLRARRTIRTGVLIAAWIAATATAGTWPANAADEGAFHVQPLGTGACCVDCTGTCTDSDQVTCEQIGGRFQAGVACGNLSPACGAALGACCHDNGSCALTTCAACQEERRACCLPGDVCIETTSIDCAQRAGGWGTAGSVCATTECDVNEACCFADRTCDNLPAAICVARGGEPHGHGTTCASTHCGCNGDVNCDGQVDLGDINAFVLYLSNPANWALAYPECLRVHGDINCDGTYPSYADINPFVALLSSTRPPIPCGTSATDCPPSPGPRYQGNYWGGPGTTCDPNSPTYGCCTVVQPSPYSPENEALNCAEDHYNGGCNSIPAVFAPANVSAHVPIYGQSGTFAIYDPNDPNEVTLARDTDWYEYTVTSPQVLTMTVRAEFAPYLAVLHAGPNASTPCEGYWHGAPPVVGASCTDVRLVTGCLPAGKYWFVVAPAAFSGVICGADYLLTLQATQCGSNCWIQCVPDHSELVPCNDQPQNVDANRGCSADPPDPNAFEVLDLTGDENYVVCGTTWATGGARDNDWYQFTITHSFRMDWVVETDVPLQASIVFQDLGGGNYGPPTCIDHSVWADALAQTCVTNWNRPEHVYQPGTYWFRVTPEDAAGPILYGYPCVLGNDYRIELTFPEGPYISEGEPTCGPWYVDIYNGGCDHSATHPVLPIQVQTSHLNEYSSRSGTWLGDPNDPNTLERDYDWYSFTTPAAPATGRLHVYCDADFPIAWELWPANNCISGPLEGLHLPAHWGAPVPVAQCYPANTTYWLRVFPTDATAVCGDAYSLALFDFTPCAVCNINCNGTTDTDNPCDDVNDYDTNYGCDNDPNGVYQPTKFSTYALEGRYCGRSYATLRLVAWQLVTSYDPDWFKLNLAAVTNLRLRIQAKFPAFVGLYAAGSDFANPDCSAYTDGTPVSSANILTACNGAEYTNLDAPGLAAGVYVGVIYPIDYFGNVLTQYYPCGSTHNDYKILVTTYVP